MSTVPTLHICYLTRLLKVFVCSCPSPRPLVKPSPCTNTGPSRMLTSLLLIRIPLDHVCTLIPPVYNTLAPSCEHLPTHYTCRANVTIPFSLSHFLCSPQPHHPPVHMYIPIPSLHFISAPHRSFGLHFCPRITPFLFASSLNPFCAYLIIFITSIPSRQGSSAAGRISSCSPLLRSSLSTASTRPPRIPLCSVLTAAARLIRQEIPARNLALLGSCVKLYYMCI